jgi:type IV pilus assembly protein PilW
MKSIRRLPRSKQRNSLLLRRPQAGLTLLEMMIALSLGLLLVAGIGTIFVGSNQTYRVQEENARIQESGRFALDVLGRSIRQAGYWNMLPTLVDLSTNPYVSATGTPTLAAVTGTDGAGTAPDSVTVQYDGTGASDCSGAVIAAGATVQEIFDLNANNLRCNATPLIANVEDLQFLYGIDTNGDQSADRYVTAPTTAQQPLVVSVRTCVVIRSQGLGITTSAQRYLNCAGALGTATGNAAFTTAADTQLHRAFVATFNLRNRVNNQP